MYSLFIFTTKNAGNHLLALGPRKAVEKQVTPAYTGGRLPVLFFDNLNFLGSMRIESKQTLNHMSDPVFPESEQM